MVLKKFCYCFCVFVFLLSSCKTTDFAIIDASYQQWYDGIGVTKGVNLYFLIQSQKKIKNIEFTDITLDRYHLTPIVVKEKKRITGNFKIKKSDTIKISAPLVLNNKKFKLTDTMTVNLWYLHNRKKSHITVSKWIRRKKIFYP